MAEDKKIIKMTIDTTTRDVEIIQWRKMKRIQEAGREE